MRSALVAASTVLLLSSLACGGLFSPPTEPGESTPAAIQNTVPGTTAAMLPLHVGDTWTYALTERRGAGFRVFGLTNKPAQTRDLGTWTLSVLSKDSSSGVDTFEALLDRHNVDDGDAKTSMTLWYADDRVWMDNGSGKREALSAEPGPRVVSTETIPCVAHYLDGMPGSCSAAPPGPLARSPGPKHGLVSREADNGTSIAQFLVGISTIGMFIPGNRKASVSATLTSFTSGKPTVVEPALYQAWLSKPAPRMHERAIKRLHRLLATHPADAESLAAIVHATQDGALRGELAAAGLVYLPEADRPAVVRVGVVNRDNHAIMRLIARSTEHVQYTQAEAQALNVPLIQSNRAQAEPLMSGDCPRLVTTYSKARTVKVFADVAGKVLSDGQVEMGCAEGFLSGAGSHHQGQMVRTLLDHTAAEHHGRLIAKALPTMPQDEDRLQLLRDQQQLLSALSEQERLELVNVFAWVEQQNEARAILGLPAAPPQSP